MVDDRGRFMFRDLPTGRFSITAEIPGFGPGAVGKQHPDDLPVPVDLGERARQTDLEIKMWRDAELSGVVVDEVGLPLAGATVEAYRSRSVAGGPLRSTSRSATTDDRGVFRIGQLLPGNYLLGVPSRVLSLAAQQASASANQLPMVAFGKYLFSQQYGLPPPTVASDGNVLVYPMTFFPGVRSARAATEIEVAAGQRRGGLAIQMTPAMARRVSGTISGIGTAGFDVPVRLLALDTQVFRYQSNLEVGQTIADAAGAFVLLGIPEGEYTAYAYWPPVGAGATARATQTRYWASTKVDVGPSDVIGVPLVLEPMPTVRGRVEFADADPLDPLLKTAGVIIEPADGRSPGPAGLLQSPRAIAIGAGGQFLSGGLLPGRYSLSLSLPVGWALQGISVGGRRVPIDRALVLGESGLDGVVLLASQHLGVVSGVVTDDTGRVTDRASVVVFPSEKDAWSGFGVTPKRVRTARTDKDGRFTFAGLPDGDYLVAAMAIEDGASSYDVATLDQLSRRAMAVTLTNAGSVQVSLVVAARK
jgi:hypothetical protein